MLCNIVKSGFACGWCNIDVQCCAIIIDESEVGVITGYQE